MSVATAPPVLWQNRIVGYGLEAPDQLLANPWNWRIHSAFQQDALAGILTTVGIIQNVIVNRTTGHIVDGHLRVTLALRTQQPLIPVTYVELSEAEERLILSTYDPLSALAGTDSALLTDLLADVQTGDAAVQALLDRLAADLPPVVPVPGAGGDDFDPTPAPGPTRCQPGDLWQIGPHRLAVADCTQAAAVAALFGDQRFRVMWTDAPYGVSYGDKNAFLNAISRANRIETPIANDHLTEADTEQLLRDAFTLAATYGTAGAACYVAAPPGPLHKRFIAALDASGFTYKHQLVWVKNQFVLGRSDYHYRHEPILYGWKEDGSHYFSEARGLDSVFEVAKPHVSDLHPTTKPLDLVQPMITNSSKPGELVYDPFLGSGTTLIAAHRAGRVCYGLELEPRYCDVILKRAEAEQIGPISRLNT